MEWGGQRERRLGGLLRNDARLRAGFAKRREQLEAMVHELLSRVREDPETSDLEKFKCMNSAAATLNLLVKLTGQTQEINEARILRLQAWQRIQDILVCRLSAWPDAFRAVGEDLQRLGSEAGP